MAACSDATIAALCCVFSPYVKALQLKTDDPTICGPAGAIEISSVSVQAVGPFGYDTSTKSLVIPDQSEYLNNDPVWGWNSTYLTWQLVFTKVNGSQQQYPVNPRGTPTMIANSFKDHGLGIQFIHSTLEGSLPASPSLLTNSAGTPNTKYRNHQNYHWFDNSIGKLTHWWDATNSAWWPNREIPRVLNVNGKGGGDFTTLSAAYSYILSLPSSTPTGDPHSSINTTNTNYWTVIVYGEVTETATVNALDRVNVVFMPGASLRCTAPTGAGVVFNGLASSPERFTSKVFDAVWSSVSPATQSISGFGAYQIVRIASTTGGASSYGVYINDMKEMSLSGISVMLQQADGAFENSAIYITGDLSGSTLPRSGVYLNKTNADCAAYTGGTVPQNVVHCAHSAGTVIMDDCSCLFAPECTFTGNGLHLTDVSNVLLSQCFFAGSTGRGNGMRILDPSTSSSSIRIATNCTFEGYGGVDGLNGAAVRATGNFSAIECLFRVAPAYPIIGTPSANSVQTSTQCVIAIVPDGCVVRLNNCVLSGETSASVGLFVVSYATWSDSKVQLSQCIVRGGLASMSFAADNAGTTKRFYGCHFEGPINGTFGTAAATTTYQTSYLV